MLRRVSARTALAVLAGAGLHSTLLAQGTPPRTPRVHALEHARVVVRPGTAIEDATVVIRDGVIVAVGKKAGVPADARRWDCTGRTIYAGLVEPWWDRTPPRKPAAREADGESRRGREREREREAPKRGAVHENALVHPETDVAETLDLKADELDDMRALGFTVAHVVPTEGVWRGKSAVVALRPGMSADQVMHAQAAQVLSLDRNRGGGGRPTVYPASIMGSVALARQSLLDAAWARDCASSWSGSKGSLPRPPDNESLDALAGVLPQSGRGRVWAKSDDVLGLLRVGALAREFDLDAIAIGSGDEYRQLEPVRLSGLRLVVPVAFPDAPPVDDDDEALAVEYETLRHWELAPENPRRLQDAGILFAFTSDGLRKRSAFRSKLRTAIEKGLSSDAALAALTIQPAQYLGLDARLGTVETGKLANLTITDGDFFAEKTRVLEVWVDGDRYEVRPKGDPVDKLRGDWKVANRGGTETRTATLAVQGASEWALRAVLDEGGKRREADDVRWSGNELLVRAGEDRLRLAPDGDSKLVGTWTRADGKPVAVEATGGGKKKGRDRADKDTEPGGVATTPTAATTAATTASTFAWPPRAEPAPRAVLVRGATIWTSGPQGRVENADLLAVGGKIKAVGKGLDAPANAVVIEAQGRHVTPGIIDCHSHSNIVGGVNEGTNNCTAEVRIADVLNSESIGIYRELAGGVTTANQLHGSANSIGGQNAVMKYRWGAPPEGLLFEGAPPGIKFALGENPKQSNWGTEATGRYPQTRMGVEQSIRERFLAARDYERALDDWKKGKTKKSSYVPRRDLQLEAVGEILRGERLVHCHSYRADEILMMMRLAEEFGFRVATFQHVLEGYKVADELAAHGAGASCFSDWWAYKFEVYDAIPYAGALMYDRGVVVSFNSDSNELARHLNLEAAKAVKYGGVPEERALEFVTLNPAKQLGIANRVGSLEPGKDADFAIWTESPLSASTRCEQTWIDGRKYFDRNVDVAARSTLESERSRLVAKAREARKSTRSEDSETTGAWQPIYWALDDDASCHEEVEP